MESLVGFIFLLLKIGIGAFLLLIGIKKVKKSKKDVLGMILVSAGTYYLISIILPKKLSSIVAILILILMIIISFKKNKKVKSLNGDEFKPRSKNIEKLSETKEPQKELNGFKPGDTSEKSSKPKEINW